MLLSFMGAIGYVMENSGLKDVINTVYATNSLEIILDRHIYFRAVRAHLMVNGVLTKIIFQELNRQAIYLRLILNF